MAELPEIVRQRLAQQAGGEHPDPDSLTAFVEGALGERERTQVLLHLGVCATCREVVSLALPEMPSLQPAPAPARSGWLRWPVLRWGAVAAAVVVVAAAVMVRETRKSPMTDDGRTASLAKHDASAAAEPQMHDKEIRTEAKSNVVAKKETSAPKPQGHDALMPGVVERRKQTETAVVQNAPVARADRVPARSAVAEMQQQRTMGPSQTAMQQALRQPSDQQALGAAVGGGIQQQSQLNMTQQTAPTPQPAAVPAAPAQARVAQNVVAADRAETPSAVGGSEEAKTAKGAAKMKSLMRVSLPARWRISSEGKLERSPDGGASWRVVPVQDGASFRAVSAIDGDVWAGGAAGVLYHSTDGGQSWARVLPRWREVALTSDISRIEFTDPLHGVVTTTSETWVTSDGGRTWSLRRQ